MPGLTYSQYITQVAQMAVVEPTDANFVSITPMMIDYSELRIYRDLDLMNVSASFFGPEYKLSSGDRKLSFPQNLPDGSSFVVSEQINLILPAGDTDPDASTRFPLLPTTKEFLDAVFGSSSVENRGKPEYYSAFNETLFFVGPVPDVDYFVEVIGTVRPAPISALNPVTFISQYLPDLFIMASLVYISAYQRNFGRQNDDPQMAQSYEGQYQTLLKSAMSEEMRKKYEGDSWSSQSAASTATKNRG